MSTKQNQSTKKDNFDAILNSQNLMNDEQLLNLDLSKLDANNFNKLLNNVSKNVQIKKRTKKDKMYKIDVNKSIRQKLRKKRNKFINNIVYFEQQKNKTELANEIKEFIKFYKETYLLNDFSLNSFVANNSDNQTKILANIMLAIIKKSKIK